MTIKAQRGNQLRTKGWRQEALLRLLENVLENAEDPDNLIVYGALGKQQEIGRRMKLLSKV